MLGKAVCAQQHGIPSRGQDSYSVTQIIPCVFKKRTSLTLVYILIRSYVSTHIIALFVYENGHVCITATPLGSSFRIALYIRKVLIFGWRGSHDPYVLEYLFLTVYLFHMALSQAHGIFCHMIWLLPINVCLLAVLLIPHLSVL